MKATVRIAALVAGVGLLLLGLGLAGIADPPPTGGIDAIDPGPSPLILLGLILAVIGGLMAYAAHLISRN